MTIGAILFSIAVILFALGLAAIQIYGVVLGFRKAWYVGLAALVFQPFAFVVGAAKLLGKDLLK